MRDRASVLFHRLEQGSNPDMLRLLPPRCEAGLAAQNLKIYLFTKLRIPERVFGKSQSNRTVSRSRGGATLRFRYFGKLERV